MLMPKGIFKTRILKSIILSDIIDRILTKQKELIYHGKHIK